MQITLTCRGCGKPREFALPDDVLPPADTDAFLCADCAAGRSMVDGRSLQEIAQTKIARKSAWRRGSRLIEFVNGKFQWNNPYKDYLRAKDRESKFRRRNGYTLAEWHARLDAIGWFCLFCGCDLDERTVCRWTVEDSEGPAQNLPTCRPCLCKRLRKKASGTGSLSEYIASEGQMCDPAEVSIA
jgi:hypothetical protein